MGHPHSRIPARFAADRRSSFAVFLLFLVAILSPWKSVYAQDRMPAIPPEQMTDAQKKAVAEIAPQGTLAGYLVPLLRSPEVMKRANALGDYLVRGKPALDKKQSELVIIMVLRHWTQQYIWSIHYQAALKAGVDADIVKAIAERRRPERMADDEQLLYDFCSELQEHQSVGDATYARMVAKFGEQGVVDTVALAGYYTLLSMMFNTTRPQITTVAPPLAP